MHDLPSIWEKLSASTRIPKGEDETNREMNNISALVYVALMEHHIDRVLNRYMGWSDS